MEHWSHTFCTHTLGMGLANAGEELRETCGPAMLVCGGLCPQAGVRKVLPSVHLRPKPQYLREKGTCRGPWQNGPCFWVGRRGEGSRACIASPLEDRWLSGLSSLQVTGEGGSEWHFSVKVELRADCRQSYGRICCLRRSPRRGATSFLPTVKLIMNEGKRLEKSQPWIMYEDCTAVRKVKANQIRVTSKANTSLFDNS